MYFNKLVNTVLKERKIQPTFNGKRTGYITTVIYHNEDLDDIYDDDRYPEVLDVYNIDSVIGWEEFDRAFIGSEDVYTLCVTKDFKQARQILSHLITEDYIILHERAIQSLQEVDKLSNIQGTFKVYEGGLTSQPYVSFAVEVDQGVYRAQQIHKDLQGVDTTGLEDLL